VGRTKEKKKPAVHAGNFRGPRKIGGVRARFQMNSFAFHLFFSGGF
jgi:hypothetical protein